MGILFLSSLLPGVVVTSFGEGIIAAVILSLLNSFVRPLIQIIALPITFVTLGIFYFIVNAAMVIWTASWVDGFEVSGWGTAILFSLLLSLFNTVVITQIRRSA